MGERTRRAKDLEFKAATEAIQGDRQVAEIAAEY